MTVETITLLDGSGDGHDFAELVELRRVLLTDGAWVDVLAGWARRSENLFETLAAEVPWHAYERKMYGRTVPVPRLIKNYDEGESFPDPRLIEAMDLLNAHYASGRASSDPRFTRAGLNLYRGGSDSVAWHSDTGAAPDEPDTMVAILSLGAPRSLSVRPRGGRASRRFDLGNGDLLVMGGTFQRTYQHAVTKTSRSVGPRISVQYRPTWGPATHDRSGFVERPSSAATSPVGTATTRPVSRSSGPAPAEGP